jgi:predicted ATPase
MKIVLTGGPSSGKSTLIKQLHDYGYATMHEVARFQILCGMEPRENVPRFQRVVLQEQLWRERLFRPDRLVFLDRGVFDGIAYCRYYGNPVPEELLQLCGERYDLVFLLEPLPFFEEDDLRTENLEFTRKITPIFEKAYQEKGLKVIRVPFLTVEKRFQFICAEVARLAPEMILSEPADRDYHDMWFRGHRLPENLRVLMATLNRGFSDRSRILPASLLCRCAA